MFGIQTRPTTKIDQRASLRMYVQNPIDRCRNQFGFAARGVVLRVQVRIEHTLRNMWVSPQKGVALFVKLHCSSCVHLLLDVRRFWLDQGGYFCGEIKIARDRANCHATRRSAYYSIQSFKGLGEVL
jgi:hypothetical protein